MTHREHFFAVLEGKRPGRMPFFPDITDWYLSKRTPEGEPRRFRPGEFIPDDNPFHKQPSSLPDKCKSFTLFDFYREFDWGFPVHICNWFDTEFENGVEHVVEISGKERKSTFRTPKGNLVHTDRLAADGTWGPCEHYVKNIGDLDIILWVVERTRFVPRYDRADAILKQLGERGVADIVLFRSPFGRLIHEYMGVERVVYALADDRSRVKAFLEVQEAKDLELVRLASNAPGRLAIISDHADQNLISPRHYEQYCIPYYQKACGILHEAGKFVSTHLDGNFKGISPLLGMTGFDLLDGCTPAPMFNYGVEELAAAMPEGMMAFCGVPALLFCQNAPSERVFALADRIMTALKGKGILNVRDILPPDGDIEQAILLGEHARRI